MRSISSWPLLAVLFVTALVHGPALENGFVMDDRPAAHPRLSNGAPNERIATLQPISVYFGTHYWHGHKESSPLYRPLTTLSFALCEHLWGDGGGGASARAQHAVNLLLHLLATALVQLLLAQAGAGPLWSAAGALVFGTHAVRSEVVSSIVGRAELLAFVFGLVAVHAFMASARRRIPLLAVSFALFASFASKESGLVWILLLPLLTYFCRPATYDHALALAGLGLRATLVVLPALLLFLGLRAAALADLPEPEIAALANPLAHVGARARIATAFEVLGHALTQSFAPLRLHADYGPNVFEVSGSILSPLRLLGLTATGALIAAVVTRSRRSPRLWIACGVWFLAFVPVSNVPFAIGTIYGERLLYTPLLALSLALGLAPRLPRAGRAALAGVVLLFVLVSSYVAHQRAPLWRDDETLFRHDVQTTPRSARLQAGVGTLELSAGDAHAAAERFERALALYPSYPEALLQLAFLARARGEPERCVALLRDLLANPHADPRRHRYLAGRALTDLGLTRADAPLAREGLEAALRADPQRLATDLAGHWDPLGAALGADWTRDFAARLRSASQVLGRSSDSLR